MNINSTICAACVSVSVFFLLQSESSVAIAFALYAILFKET